MKGVCFTCFSAMNMTQKQKTKISGHLFLMITTDYKLFLKKMVGFDL